MIGQDELLQHLINAYKLKKLPQFMMIVSSRGGGKKTLMRTFANTVNMNYTECDTSVDTIRDVINSAYNTSENVLYVIPNARAMSITAQNALLKLAEEPPKHAYIAVLVHSVSDLLPTISSRAFVYHLMPYSSDALVSYLLKKYPDKRELIPIVQEVCETPGEVNIIAENNGLEMYDYTKKVIDNIAVVSGSNSFKIADKLNLGNDDTKYDLLLFLRMFSSILMDRVINRDMSELDTLDVDEVYNCLTGVEITGQYMAELRISTINKQMLFDNWILDIRGAWR